MAGDYDRRAAGRPHRILAGRAGKARRHERMRTEMAAVLCNTDRKGAWNMKSSSMNTHMGNISIDNEVIAQYAGSVAVECFGIVGMAGVNVRDGVFSLLKKESMTRGISVSLTPEGKLIIDFHVIVSYGVNIPTVADNLIESVRYRVEEFTGLEIEKMNVFVEGVKVID